MASRRLRALSLACGASLALLFAQMVWPVAAIAMLPCSMSNMATMAPNMGMTAPILCTAACTGQDGLLDCGSSSDKSPSLGPPHAQQGFRHFPRYGLVAPVPQRPAHGRGPPLRILFCRLLD
jgi:hypothetical protein